MAELKTMSGLTVTCPHCGANLSWNPELQTMSCPFCGSSFSPDDAELAAGQGETAEAEHGGASGTGTAAEHEGTSVAETAQGGSFQAIEYTCSQCGAKLYTTEETAATFCSYCGSSSILEASLVEENKPNLIIPFAITKEQAIENYRKYVKSRSLFAPAYLTADAEVEKFRGIYMPYWVYRLSAQEDQVSVEGESSHRSGDYIYTDHYLTTFRYLADYDGIHFDASSKFADNLSQVISPYNVRQSKPFDPSYLSGYYADLGDVPRGTYQELALDTAERDVSKRLLRSSALRGAHTTDGQVRRAINMDATTRRGLFPVWFLCIRNSENRLTYAAVNGQTGEVAADLPVSTGKYLIFALILTALAFLLLEFAPSMTPPRMAMISLVLSGLAWITALVQKSKLKKQESKQDDAGYVAVQNANRNSKDPSDKAKDSPESSKEKKVPVGAWKPFLGIIAVLAVILLKPVSDLFYYGAALFSSIMMAWSFVDIIKVQSRLATRKIPQFEKRGGDQDAIVY